MFETKVPVFSSVWTSDDHQFRQLIAGNKSNVKQWLTYRIAIQTAGLFHDASYCYKNWKISHL